MSQENVEVVQRLFPPNWEFDGHVMARYRDESRALFEPLIAEGFSVRFSAPGLSATYRGADAMSDGMRDYMSAFLKHRTVIERLIDGGDVVVALGHQHCQTKTHAVEFDQEAGIVHFFDTDGKLTRIELYQHWAEALEAAGVSE